MPSLLIHCYVHLLNALWKWPLAEMQRRAACIRPKVIGPFPRPRTSGSYVHRAALIVVYTTRTSKTHVHVGGCQMLAL
jgi:hypothetical protein